MKDWSSAEETVLSQTGLPSEWRRAHRDFVDAVLAVSSKERAQGARMCVNIASVHIPEFARPGGTYKNAYDLAVQARIVGAASAKLSATRLVVDSLLPLPAHQSPQSTYFGAVETTGCGMRYYGDFCLVLCRSAVTDDTVILDRNSYDLVRPPLNAWRLVPQSKIDDAEAGDPNGIREAQNLAGRLSGDLASMVMIGLVRRRELTERRLTIGQLSDSILDDEDYIEVLKDTTFSVSDVDEVRTSSSEAAAESLIGDRLKCGPPPAFVELLWRSQRRRASSVLIGADRAVRVVTTSGRVRS